MESMLRKFGLKKSETKETESRLKLQKELFQYQKCVEYGFPHKSSAIDYNPSLDMFAIGTKDGYIRIYGGPGVQFCAEHGDEVVVQRIFFYGQGNLITHCSDKRLYLWELSQDTTTATTITSTTPTSSTTTAATTTTTTQTSQTNTKRNIHVAPWHSTTTTTTPHTTHPTSTTTTTTTHPITTLTEVNNIELANRIQQPSAFCLTKNHEYLYIGSENGHVYSVSLGTFKLTDQIIYRENLVQNIPEDVRKLNQGAVESIVQHPQHQNQILIGFIRGLIIHYDVVNKKCIRHFISNQQIESVAFHKSGEQFISSHSNGYYIVWDTNSNTTNNTNITAITTTAGKNTLNNIVNHHHHNNNNNNNNCNNNNINMCDDGDNNNNNNNSDRVIIPYGPFPCKAITKLLWKVVNKRNETMTIYSGGMPKSSFGDHHTVTVAHSNGRQVCFDFTSKVIDFVTLDRSDRPNRDNDDDEDDDDDSDDSYGTSCGEAMDSPYCLLVLTEEELVSIDLSSDPWAPHHMPYLSTLHSSAITCCLHINGVDSQFYDELKKVGARQNGNKYSGKPWPIRGGINYNTGMNVGHDLLITGHEDGTVMFWDVSTIDISLIAKYDSTLIFESSSSSSSSPVHEGDDDNDNDGGGDGDDNEDDWPPFKKVGTYDPYSDDPRLAIRKIDFCKRTRTLIVAGTSGQLVVSKFESVDRRLKECEIELKPVRLNLLDRHFVWKGHEAMALRKGQLKLAAGFQPSCLVQVYPPAACTAVCLKSEWGLVAVGTAHGFGLVDYKQKKFVEVRCTLNPNDLSGSCDQGMSRRKSFKKSLRESFRRLRSRRSERHKKSTTSTSSNIISSPQKHPPSSTTTTVIDLDVPKPVERAVEARSPDDVTGSIVRALYFADTFLISGHPHSPSFWAGTNAGTVYIYQVNIPDDDRRRDEEVQSLLAKEIHLRHHAPIISINVIDKNGQPLDQLESRHSKIPDLSANQPHSVVICSEEQIKIFTLPSLSAKEKFKLTAHEGSKIRRTAFVNFISRSDPKYSEFCLTCLSNLGETHIFSIPQLKRQLKVECIRKDNIVGIVSCIFSNHGDAFYMESPSEFSRFSVSTKVHALPNCGIGLTAINSNNNNDKCDNNSHNRRQPMGVNWVNKENNNNNVLLGDNNDGGGNYGDEEEEKRVVAGGERGIDEFSAHVFKQKASSIPYLDRHHAHLHEVSLETTSQTIATNVSANSADTLEDSIRVHLGAGSG